MINNSTLSYWFINAVNTIISCERPLCSLCPWYKLKVIELTLCSPLEQKTHQKQFIDDDDEETHHGSDHTTNWLSVRLTVFTQIMCRTGPFNIIWLFNSTTGRKFRSSERFIIMLFCNTYVCFIYSYNSLCWKALWLLWWYVHVYTVQSFAED